MVQNRYHVIGVMSGTSLDGLDLAHCSFQVEDGKWTYEILQATTVPYEDNWKEKLAGAGGLSAESLVLLDHSYGKFIGEQVKAFILDNKLSPDLIASHGHTVFHRPEMGITYQIGSGWKIMSETGFPVVYDFRSGDVALGGQGAPLVPIGDRLLFGEYRYCLNLGGIANISFEKEHQRLAFDVCPVNMALNHLSLKLGKAYDEGGAMAASGNVIDALLGQMNALSFYRKQPPKSLGREWFEAEFLPLLQKPGVAVPDLLRTCVEHIAVQLENTIRQEGATGKILVTGGGAHNQFLIERLKQQSSLGWEVPDRKTADFKEALIFAFLGVLKLRNEVNTLCSVTGARADSVGGIYLNSRA